MGYIARLRKGAAIFDLDGTNGVGLTSDFEPPSAQIASNIAAGTGSNFYGGGEFISRKAGPVSFYFAVRSLAGSNALAEQQIDRLANFLSLAGDKRDPVWFEFRPDNNVSFEPIWGQTGAFRRVEVLALEGLEKSGYASLGIARNRVVIASVTITVNMPVLGNTQRAAVFTGGGLIEDWWGEKDNKSRGIILAEAITNKMTNPVFGNADWDNGWTTGAGVLSASNIDPEFILFGNVSAKLIGIAGAANTFTQSIAAGNTNKHSAEFYVKRPDGAAVSAADCAVYYGAAKTTTYTSIGNGWYKVSAVNFDGIAAATATGLTVVSGACIYLTGAMLIEKAYNVPMCYGDMIGCSWATTAHASTSARGDAVYTLSVDDKTFNIGQFTIRLVWKASRAITGAAIGFIYGGAPNIDFTWTNADKWSLTDGTNTALSAALSIVAGTTYTLHLTGSLAGGLNVYLNGASIATNATYTPPAAPTTLIIGNAGTNDGTFKGLTIYDRAMTQTEITADYTNILPLITADKRVDWMPYVNYPSSYIYNFIDTDYTETDFIVAGSVPGDVPAEVSMKLTPSASFAKSIWIGNHVDGYRHWINPYFRFYMEAQGTGTAATDSGAEVLTIDLPTAVPRTSITRVVNFPDYIHGTFHFFVRMRASANTHTVSVGYYLLYNGGYINCLADKTVSVTTTSKWYYLGKLSLEPAKMIGPGGLTLTVGMNFSCASAADDLLVDYGEVINGEFCVLKQYASDAPGGGGAASYPAYAVIMGKQAYFDTNNRLAKVIGDEIKLQPEAANTITMHFADDAGAHVVADYINATNIDITPRWVTE